MRSPQESRDSWHAKFELKPLVIVLLVNHNVHLGLVVAVRIDLKYLVRCQRAATVCLVAILQEIMHNLLLSSVHGMIARPKCIDPEFGEQILKI